MEKKNVSTPSSNKGTSDPRNPFAPIVFLPVLLLLFWVGVLACGREERATSGSAQNRPPTITSVALLPENPDHDSDLSLVVQCEDPEGDSITHEYQWMINDREISAGNASLLKSGNFKKGDSIRVKITPSDGKTQGKPFLSPVVRINNSLPVIEKVWIEPKVVGVQDQLRVVVESSDKDKDFIYYTYQWEKNGAILTEEKAETLESGQFKKGDSLSVVVVADDREARGISKRSDPVVVSNSPPMITSSPPTSLKGNAYLYQVKAEDPDLDPISFSLKSGPKGMVIDQTTGLLRWEIQKENEGTQVVEIEASDPDGAKSLQHYTLAVEFH
jgi:hypothetical protein